MILGALCSPPVLLLTLPAATIGALRLVATAGAAAAYAPAAVMHPKQPPIAHRQATRRFTTSARQLHAPSSSGSSSSGSGGSWASADKAAARQAWSSTAATAASDGDSARTAVPGAPAAEKAPLSQAAAQSAALLLPPRVKGISRKLIMRQVGCRVG